MSKRLGMKNNSIEFHFNAMKKNLDKVISDNSKLVEAGYNLSTYDSYSHVRTSSGTGFQNMNKNS